MSEMRAALLWLACGVLGMVGLLLVTRFGVAVGLAMIVAFSTPTLAGSAMRWQVVSLSGLMTGFGMLWLLLVAGEAMAGIALHGSVAGHVLFGLVVLALGSLLGLWHLVTSGRGDELAARRLAAGERPAHWQRSAYWDRSAQWIRSSGGPGLAARARQPIPIELRLNGAAYRRRPPG